MPPSGCKDGTMLTQDPALEATVPSSIWSSPTGDGPADGAPPSRPRVIFHLPRPQQHRSRGPDGNVGTRVAYEKPCPSYRRHTMQVPALSLASLGLASILALTPCTAAAQGLREV